MKHERCPLCLGPLSIRRGVQGPWLICWGGCRHADVAAHIAATSDSDYDDRYSGQLEIEYPPTPAEAARRSPPRE